MRWSKIVPLVVSAAMIGVMLSGCASRPMAPRGSEESTGNVKVLFKLDNRLTQGLYMGERWVSPARFTGAPPAEEVLIMAKVEAVDAQGVVVSEDASWASSDSDVVTVTPANGAQVTLTVRQPGESRLTVATGGIEKQLTVKAEALGDLLKVEIVQ